MSVLRFSYPGTPRAWARATPLHGRAVNTRQTREAEHGLAWWMASEARQQGWLITTSPVSLMLRFVFPVPSSWPKWRRDLAAGWPKQSKPDADNLTKLVKDAANGVLWVDDAQVCELEARKVYARDAEQPCTFVVVRRLDPLPKRRPIA